MKKIFFKVSFLIVPVIAFSLLQGCSKKVKTDQTTTDKVKTADVLWSFKAEGPIVSSPVKFENNIIFGSNDKKLYSIDLNTHEKVWSFESDGRISNTPIIEENTVIFSSNSTCYALDAKTGKEVWKYKSDKVGKDLSGGYDYHSPSPTLYKSLVIFQNRSGDMYGINKVDGKLQWQYKAEGCDDVITTPAIQDNILCIGDVSGNIFGIDLDTQKTIWKKSIGTKIVQAAFIYKDYVYFSGRDNIVAAYSLNDGGEKWSYAEPIGSWLTGDMIAKDDIVYVPGSDNHKIIAFNYNDGKVVGNLLGEANIFSKPTIKEDILYFTSGDVYKNKTGAVSGYDLSTKKKVLLKMFESTIYSSPMVDEDVIYVGSSDGNLYALDGKVE
ncbi:PQQ-binding-like beta-propeller repeat protein [Clostridium paraputrificum]|uniref:PQQ-binding-like beta-propeller repeat protein n=1 Tax=Clostridium paraputrificum TaxID=29363 RepID=UPI003D33B13A